MVSVLNSGSSGPGSSPGRGHCVLYLGKTLNMIVLSQCLSPPRFINGYQQIISENLTNCGEVTRDGLASRPGEVVLSHFMLQKPG